MERHTPAEESGKGSPDAPAEIWTRAQEAKKPALILRLELLAYVEGTTTTKLDALLQEADVSPEARTLVRRSLASHQNAKVKNYGDQTVDLLVLLAAERGLPHAWDPDENELRKTLPAVVRRSCAYGTTAERVVRERVSGSRRTLRNLRVAVGADAEERLQDTVLAGLFFRGLQLGAMGPAERADLAMEAEGELLARHAVMVAAVEMSCRADEHAAAAWPLAVEAIQNPYYMIVDRGDSPASTGSRTTDLERIARREAERIGRVDEGVLQAAIRFTLTSFSNDLKTITARARRIGHFEKLAAPAGDGGGETPESELDGAAARATADQAAPDASGDPWAWIATGVGMVERGEMPPPTTERAVLIDDILALVEVCRIVTENDAGDWLATWYEPVSRTTVKGGLGAVWSLCQAARPHYVKWPGYPERQSDRQRRWVADVAKELQGLRINEERKGDDER